MLRYHTKKREMAFDNWVEKNKSATRRFLRRRRRQIAGLLILLALCFLAVFTVRNSNLEHFMPFKKITAKNLDRISEDAFRKMMGYDYGERIYVGDTAEIRRRLEASDMVLGDVAFTVKLISRELEIAFSEARPLFALMAHSTDFAPVIYSDKGSVYPYSANAADLPVVEAKKDMDINLAIKFLNEIKRSDVSLYSRISQIVPSEEERQISVFFNDVSFKTKFSLESGSWQTAFRHYRQLTRNMRIANLDSASVLDLRFKQLAYTIAKGGSL